VETLGWVKWEAGTEEEEEVIEVVVTLATEVGGAEATSAAKVRLSSKMADTALPFGRHCFGE